MAFQITDPDFKRSPCTGMTRRHWLECGRWLLNGVLRHVRDADSPINPPKQPGKSYPRPDDPPHFVAAMWLEALVRSHNLAAPLLENDPALRIRGLNVGEFYRKRLLDIVTPGTPSDAPIAARSMNVVLDAIASGTEKAVHFCFGNYGGQTIQKGTWRALIDFLNALHTDHLVLELAHRPADDLDALREVDPRIKLGIGVIDIKVNGVETPEDIARRLEHAEQRLGKGRVRFIHPDCGFWMLKRSIADRKIAALTRGRDIYLGR